MKTLLNTKEEIIEKIEANFIYYFTARLKTKLNIMNLQAKGYDDKDCCYQTATREHRELSQMEESFKSLLEEIKPEILEKLENEIKGKFILEIKQAEDKLKKINELQEEYKNKRKELLNN